MTHDLSVRTKPVRAALLLWLAVASAACASGPGASDTRAAGEGVGRVATSSDALLASTHLRVVAGNLSTGNNQSYDPGEGIRVLQALKADVALLQELNYGANDDAAVRTFVSTTFGEEFSYFRESGAQIPNAVVSRFPIVASGVWADASVSNRGFAWAKIAAPGAHELWAVSVHLLTKGASSRAAEAAQLVGYLEQNVPRDAYVIVAGDFNTSSRSEAAITDFAGLLDTSASYPDDQSGNANTSQSRSKPHDWLLASPALSALHVPTVLGSVVRPNGLVFDTRVFSPITDAPPARVDDSGAVNMQHMPVVKDFALN